jgi:hypothetical protein
MTPMPTDTVDPIDALLQTEQAKPKPTLPRREMERTDISITLPEADPERGHTLAQRWSCVRCHITNQIGPPFEAYDDLPAIEKRAEIRIADPNYTGSATNTQEYLIESISDPRLYRVEGDWKEDMWDSTNNLPEQDLADIIGWLLNLDE